MFQGCDGHTQGSRGIFDRYLTLAGSLDGRWPGWMVAMSFSGMDELNGLTY